MINTHTLIGNQQSQYHLFGMPVLTKCPLNMTRIRNASQSPVKRDHDYIVANPQDISQPSFIIIVIIGTITPHSTICTQSEREVVQWTKKIGNEIKNIPSVSPRTNRLPCPMSIPRPYLVAAEYAKDARALLQLVRTDRSLLREVVAVQVVLRRVRG